MPDLHGLDKPNPGVQDHMRWPVVKGARQAQYEQGALGTLTRDTQPMIHFLLDGWPHEIRPGVENAVFELGLRMGRRFAIHRHSASVPSDGYVIRYGGVPDTPRNDVLDLPVSRDAWTGKILCQSRRWEEEIVWAASSSAQIDVVPGTQELLAFRHEKRLCNDLRDRFGRIPPDASPWFRENLHLEPLVENNARYLLSLLDKQKSDAMRRFQPWGEGKFAVAISHDIDGPQLHSLFSLARSAFLGFVRRDRHEREAFAIGMLGRLFGFEDPYWNFSRYQTLERSYAAKSTFFLYPGPLRSVPKHGHDPHYNPQSSLYRRQIRTLVDLGWEVGLHAAIRGDSLLGYRDAKAKLEELGAGRISGVRAHYWGLDWEDPHQSWCRMAEAGFEYDTSLNPMTIGYRGGAMLPRTVRTSGAASSAPPFLALSTPFMDAYLVPRFSEVKPDEIARRIEHVVARATQSGGLIVLDWHVRSLANFGPFAGFLAPLLDIIDRVRHNPSCRFLKLSEVAELWNAYARNLFQGFGTGGVA